MPDENSSKNIEDWKQIRSPIRRSYRQRQKRREDELKNWRDIQTVIKRAMEHQKNIGADIERGILLLEESLNVMDQVWKSRISIKFCHEN